MGQRILVTGATGSLGGAVVNALEGKDHAIRAGCRAPQKATFPKGVEVVRVDFNDPATFDPALAGAEGVFLIAPPMDPEAPAKLRPFVDRARALGVRHIVFTSALGVDRHEQAPLRVVERHLMESGVSYTILRPNFFMENFSTGFALRMIKDHGGIFLAAGDGKTSFISTRDIADVAAAAFMRRLYGEQYNLTGPQALDHTEVAAIISEVSGRTVTYQPLSEEQMLEGARASGLPEAAVQYMGVLYGVVRAGLTAAVTGDVRRVLDREPATFHDFASQNAARWRQS